MPILPYGLVARLWRAPALRRAQHWLRVGYDSLRITAYIYHRGHWRFGATIEISRNG
jgi:hypothetical protein